MNWRQPLRILSNYPVGLQIGIAVFGAILLVLATATVSSLSIRQISQVQQGLLGEHLPKQQLSLQLARQAWSLAALLPRLIDAETPAGLSEALQQYERRRTGLALGVERLQETGQSADELRAAIAQLAEQASLTGQLTDRRIRMAERMDEARTRLAALELRLNQNLTTAIDDQLFFLMKGLRRLTDVPAAEAQRRQPSEMVKLHALAMLQRDSTLLTSLLTSALAAVERSHLQPIREKFFAAMARIRRNSVYLQGTDLTTAVTQDIEEVAVLAGEPSGLLSQADRFLQIGERQRRIRDKNRSTVEFLVSAVSRQVDTNSRRAEIAMADANATIFKGYAWVASFTAFGLMGALAYSWFYVRNILTRRLVAIASAMKTMAGGDLTQPLSLHGQDEIADMAAALDVFRQHALEVQRLNLVEKLAAELEEKNGRLEDTLAELGKAQQQIVLREKLAALGELTAGVAHEIKNPLNFVNNFSASSVELCDELEEEMAAAGFADTGAAEELQEITGMLKSNMEKIRSHGQRADSIVNSMLSLGRTAGTEVVEGNLEKLSREHAALAWHSVRAAIADFRGEIVYEFPAGGLPAKVVAEDIGRVVLNLVTNACHACWERQQSGEQGYQPVVSVRGAQQGSWIEIAVADNGVGMTDEVRAQVFDPFFTTKDTGVGTGLGLSMSFDLARKHNGELLLQTESGQGSVFTLRLPAC